MLTSFGANVPVFWSERLLLFCKSPALHHSKPGFRGRKARLSSGSPVLEKECVSPKSDYPSF